jgi:pimeloyl-ACP methyl ester carboxylesterase
MPKRLPRTRTLKGDPPLAHYDSAKAIDPTFSVLLIHASLARSEDWENIFPRLATRYRTVAYDQRGHGKSGRTADYSLRAFGADAVRMVREIVKGPTVVIGHSLGALCAIAAAAHVPEHVIALVLEDPTLAYGKGWKPDQYAALRDALAKKDDDEKAFIRFVERWPLASPGPRGERTYGESRGFYAAERMITYMRDIDPAFADSRTRGVEEDAASAIKEWLAGIRCPVLVLAGEPRLGSNLDDAGEWTLKRSVKDLTVRRFPGTGHLLHGFRPEQYLENLEPFLRRLREAPVA